MGRSSDFIGVESVAMPNFCVIFQVVRLQFAIAIYSFIFRFLTEQKKAVKLAYDESFDELYLQN